MNQDIAWYPLSMLVIAAVVLWWATAKERQ